MFFKASLIAAVASMAVATDSICDRYTTAIFMQNNATNQYTLLKYVVNTALIGNFTPAPTGSKVAVQGILNPNGTYNGTTVNLVPYFNGGLLSTNDGSKPSAKNFLDDGGAAPLMALMPANGTSSNQYFLVTHLYQFFGALLGCSGYGMTGFSSYMGEASQYSVHKYMDLNPYQMGYFIQEVALAAQSFGVNSTDIATVGSALTSLFNYKCLAPANITSTEPELQSICIDPSCPIAANASCSSYDAVLAPAVANASLAMGQGVSSTVTLATSGATSGTAGPAASNTKSTVTNAVAGSTTSSSTSGALMTAGPVLGAIMAAGAFALAV